MRAESECCLLIRPFQIYFHTHSGAAHLHSRKQDYFCSSNTGGRRAVRAAFAVGSSSWQLAVGTLHTLLLLLLLLLLLVMLLPVLGVTQVRSDFLLT